MHGVYQKSREGFHPATPPGFFACEAAGLHWLDAAVGGPRVAQVLDFGPDHLDLEFIPSVHSIGDAAFSFGAKLANMHNAGAPAWGSLPPGLNADGGNPLSDHGFFGPLDSPIPMEGGHWHDWPSFYGDARLKVIAQQGHDRGVFTNDDVALFDKVAARLPELAGASLDDVPSRLHGDLWNGNIMWSFGKDHLCEVVLIDPAAHGGHRETDLAMLRLFGAPHLAEIMAGYESVNPLADGWEGRIKLHQLYPIAVHAVLFGGHYLPETREILNYYANLEIPQGTEPADGEDFAAAAAADEEPN
ncbi:MAG: fructosamine kinase family protein [Cellulomonadaceae bacterium]|jgi:fructosamine-3-kinase|nr:fructosamine kinase family protein [Cellulomonadaceae bacterium]